MTARESTAVDTGGTALATLLELAETGPDCFTGVGGDLNLPRVFGGHVLAQGLLAAARTVAPARPAHSLHAYFLRAGDPRAPIEHRVSRVRDGRRFACRTVSAEQDGTVIATMTISFAGTGGNLRHQRRAPQAGTPADVPTLIEASEAWGGLSPAWAGFFDTVDIRLDPKVVRPGATDLGSGDPAQWTDHVWQRIPGTLPDDPLLHQAMLLYLSDIMQLASALVPHGISLGQEEVAGGGWDGVSLDHAIWFHQSVRADDWLLFEQVSPVGAAGRALTRAEVFTPDGTLVASVAQEGLIFGPDGRQE